MIDTITAIGWMTLAYWLYKAGRKVFKALQPKEEGHFDDWRKLVADREADDDQPDRGSLTLNQQRNLP